MQETFHFYLFYLFYFSIFLFYLFYLFILFYLVYFILFTTFKRPKFVVTIFSQHTVVPTTTIRSQEGHQKRLFFKEASPLT